MSILRHLFILLSPLWLLACASREAAAPATPPRPAWMPAPLTSMAYSSRIGIMIAMDNQIAHASSSTVSLGKSITVQNAAFDLPGYTAESLRKSILAHTPYQPVIVRPSAKLIRDKAVWQKEVGKDQSLGSWQQEFDAILKQNQLKLLIIITAAEDDGLLGSGYYTRSFLGKRQTAVFSTLHFYRVSGQPGKLLLPVASSDERSFADLPSFPNPPPEPLPKPMQNAVDTAIKNLIDQKVGAFVALMK